MPAGKFLTLAMLSTAALAAPGLSPAQDFRLGDETRARKLSVDTVAGRRVTFTNGRSFVFHRDGRFSRNDRDGDASSGTWSIAYETVLNIAPKRGEAQQIVFVTIEGRLYVRNTGRHSRAGQTAEPLRVVNIEAAD